MTKHIFIDMATRYTAWAGFLDLASVVGLIAVCRYWRAYKSLHSLLVEILCLISSGDLQDLLLVNGRVHSFIIS